MNRRSYLAAAAGAAAAVGLAGCTRAVASVPPPAIPESRLDGWEERDDRQRTVFEETFAGATVEAKAHTVVYGDAALRREVERETLGYVDASISLVSATRVEFSPDLDGVPGIKGAVLDRTEEESRAAFRSQLEDVGVRDVERVGTGTLSIDTGESARLTRYEGRFPVGPIEFELVDGETVTIGEQPLTVAGDLAIWHGGDYVLIGGGAYPAEDFEASVERSPTDAIDVSVEIDLGLDPGALREEVRGIVTAVE